MTKFYGHGSIGAVRMLKTKYSPVSGVITVRNVTSKKRTVHPLEGAACSYHEAAAHSHMRIAYPEDGNQPYVLLGSQTDKGYIFAVVRVRDAAEIRESGVFGS